MTAGYSKRPLIAKLGIKPGNRIMLIQPPQGYLDLLGELPPGTQFVSKLPCELCGPLDFIHVFTTTQAELAAASPSLKAALADDGMLWVSWPKRASKAPTDLDENLVRALGLEQGLVDVKVAAIDATWSALKFVYRLTDRLHKRQTTKTK